MTDKGVGKKISRGGGATEKDRNIEKQTKIALLSFFRGGNETKDRKITKKTQK